MAVPRLLERFLNFRVGEQLTAGEQRDEIVSLESLGSTLLAVNQAQDGRHHKTDLLGALNRFHGRFPGSADIVNNDHAGAGHAVITLGIALSAMLFGVLPDDEGRQGAILFAFCEAHCRDGGNYGIGPESQAADRIGFDPKFLDLVEDQLGTQVRPLWSRVVLLLSK